MKSPQHTIIGTYIEDDGDGTYMLVLLRGDMVVGRFSTVSAAVAGAASGLMDWADDPERLGQVWRYTVAAYDGKAGQGDVVPLDTIGEVLVDEAEEMQRSLSGDGAQPMNGD